MITSFKSWFEKPFNSQGTVWDWALFILLIMILIFAWSRVIGMFEAVGESIA